jgi:hypothetical protein
MVVLFGVVVLWLHLMLLVGLGLAVQRSGPF